MNLRRLFTHFLLFLILISCNVENNEQKSELPNLIELSVKDSTGRFEGKKLDLRILDKYNNGELKRIQYSIGDTILEQFLLQTGYIYKSITYVNGKVLNINKSNKIKWKFEKLYKVDLVVERFLSDTLNIWVNDDSYIWSKEYVKWKSDYFLWMNQNQFTNVKTVKTHFVQDGKDFVQEYIYDKNDLKKIVNLYSKNNRYDRIASIVLGKFEPTEIVNLRDAHQFLNDEQKEYGFDFVRLLYDFSNCKSKCFAEKRLRFIGEMLQEVKLYDFWSDTKVEPEGFIRKLNEIFEIMNKEKI
jgi:hypothetical protein